MDDTEEIDPALAAAMGFSSFGSHRPAKRVKHGDHAFKASSTGANSTPVGARRMNAAVEESVEKVDGADGNPDEIDLGDDDEDGGVGELSKNMQTQPENVASDSATSQQTAKKEKQKQKSKPAGGGLAGFLSRGQNLKPPAPTTNTPTPSTDNLSNAQTSSNLPQPSASLPARPAFSLTPAPGTASAHPSTSEHTPPASVAASSNVLSISRLEDLTPADLNALRKGVRNEQGDMVYFQPSFIEDP